MPPRHKPRRFDSIATSGEAGYSSPYPTVSLHTNHINAATSVPLIHLAHGTRLPLITTSPRSSMGPVPESLVFDLVPHPVGNHGEGLVCLNETLRDCALQGSAKRVLTHGFVHLHLHQAGCR